MLKFKYKGPEDEITLRGVTFKKGKAVDVDDTLASKIKALDDFVEVKGRKNAKSS